MRRGIPRRAGAGRSRVGEMQQHPRVALHRSADVAEQHERTRTNAARPAPSVTTSPPCAQAVGDCAAEIESRAAAPNPPARPALTRIPHECESAAAPSAISADVNAAKSLSGSPPRSLQVGMRLSRPVRARASRSRSPLPSTSAAQSPVERQYCGRLVPTRVARYVLIASPEPSKARSNV